MQHVPTAEKYKSAVLTEITFSALDFRPQLKQPLHHMPQRNKKIAAVCYCKQIRKQTRHKFSRNYQTRHLVYFNSDFMWKIFTWSSLLAAVKRQLVSKLWECELAEMINGFLCRELLSVFVVEITGKKRDTQIPVLRRIIQMIKYKIRQMKQTGLGKDQHLR